MIFVAKIYRAFDHDNTDFNYKEILKLSMNPYFTPSYPYANPMQQPYAFSHPVIPQPLPTFPQQPVNSIQSMYTTVQPYYNKQFLTSTFGNKTDYIQIFLTLAHEDKLKMYLLMEEKKLYGQVGDKEAYQKILRQIVQKLQNYNAFHQGNKKVENSEDKKKKDLESKIDSICEVSFQKLKFPLLATEKNKVAQPKTQELDEIQLEDEWVQSTTQEESTPKLGQSSQAENPSAQDKFNIFYALDNNKENFSHSAPATSSNPVVFNMFNFDSDMERAMTKQIGLKKASQMQKLSIWDLQVQQSDLKTNLREVFKKKKQVADVKNVEPKQEESLTKSYNPANSFDLYAQFSSTQPHSAGDLNYDAVKTQENQGFSQAIQASQNDFDLFSFGHETYSPQVPVESHKMEQIQFVSHSVAEKVEQAETYEQNTEEQWEDGLQKENSPQKQQTNTYQTATVESQPLPFAFQEQIAPTYLQVQPVKPNENLFDFDVLSQKVEIQPPVVNLQAADLFLSARGHKQPENEQPNVITEDCHQVIIPQISQQTIQTVIDLGPYQNNIMNSQLFLPDNEKKYQILDCLKIDLSQQQKRTIEKQLKTKSFECNTDFYLKIINYLREISLESSPEFQHFNEQYRIAKEMHELTMRYTSVVDEEEEQKVERVIKQSKALYTKIYNKSSLTEKYVQHLLSDKNKEKGLHYKFGRILVDSCINIELISRASAQESKQNVFNTFCLLFTLEKINSLNKLKSIAQALISCTNQEFDRYKSLNEQLFREAQESAEEYPQAVTYIKGLLKMAAICERVIHLLKACFIKTNSNLVKTLKNCKDLKNRFSRYSNSDKTQLYPSAYGTILKECIEKNCSLYDLHAKFSSISQRNPICQICLLQLGSQGQRHQQKGWYHYSCFNLMRSLTNLDYI